MIFLGLFIFFIFLLAYFRKKGTRQQEDLEAAFWERENEANHARRKDISGLPYITIPLEKFPMDICDNSELKEYERILTELSTQKILKLEGQTNTDLKLQYGASNLEELSEYDQNYATLCRTLVEYAEYLLKLDYTAEAQTVLEFGISCGSDHSRNYRLLAELYHKQGSHDKLIFLQEQANALASPMKQSILANLATQIDSLNQPCP